MHPDVYRFPQSPYLKTLDINSTLIQSLLSSDCRQYCIFYLYQRSRGIPYTDIISELRHNKKPDLFVRNDLLQAVIKLQRVIESFMFQPSSIHLPTTVN